ncbi:MAG: TadE/TadG family type IV pilus assembly protein [Acidimicrobiales bacterium]
MLPTISPFRRGSTYNAATTCRLLSTTVVVHTTFERAKNMADDLVSTERGCRGRRVRDERGAALVEFALIFPIFMMIVLGMFSGGTAYDQKSAMSSATREGARYAATLPLSAVKNDCTPADPAVPPPAIDTQIKYWLHCVAEYVVKASEGKLGVGTAGWEVCVAYVYAPTSGPPLTYHETHVGDTVTLGGGYNEKFSGQCPNANDAAADDKPRVQVMSRRNGKIDALFVTHTFDLTTRTITRFEAVP